MTEEPVSGETVDGVRGEPAACSCPAAAATTLLTAVAAVGAGDELLRPLVAVLLLGPQAEAADGDGLCHRLQDQGEKIQGVSRL